MHIRYRIEPGSAARAAESEPASAAFPRIQAGSAAKAAEESARAIDAAPSTGSTGVRLRAASGAKFEFAPDKRGVGEAPVVASSKGTRADGPTAAATPIEQLSPAVDVSPALAMPAPQRIGRMLRKWFKR